MAARTRSRQGLRLIGAALLGIAAGVAVGWLLVQLLLAQ